MSDPIDPKVEPLKGCADTQDSGAIARSLTKAQRGAVIGAQWRERRGAWHPEGWYTGPADKRVRRAQARHGLIRDYVRTSYPLNEAGLLVRDHLRNEGVAGK